MFLLSSNTKPNLAIITWSMFSANLQCSLRHNKTATTAFMALCPGLCGWGQYQKKHSPTHIYPDHQPTLISFLHLLWSKAASLFNLRAWQILAPSLSTPGPLWSTSSWSTSSSGTLCFIFHTFLHSIIDFFSLHNTCPYHHNLFFCSTEIMSSIPSLSLNSLRGTLFYLNVTHPCDHSHLCLLTCHLIFLSYGSGLTSRQHTTLHTTAVQSPPTHNCFMALLIVSPFHSQWYIPIGKQWCQLPKFIPFNLNHGLYSVRLHQHLQLHSTCHLPTKSYPLTPDLY